MSGHDIRLLDRRRRSGRDCNRVLRILPDVRHGRPQAAFAMNALVRTGRCDPGLIEAARGWDADALVSLLSAAQPDVRRYAARYLPRGRYG